jgi:hypothetical protein
MNEPIPTHTVEESMIWRNGRNNGIREERERIIKLLDDECKISVPTDWHPNHCTCQAFIALIKAENTDKSTVHTSADNAITDTQGENK